MVSLISGGNDGWRAFYDLCLSLNPAHLPNWYSSEYRLTLECLWHLILICDMKISSIKKNFKTLRSIATLPYCLDHVSTGLRPCVHLSHRITGWHYLCKCKAEGITQWKRLNCWVLLGIAGLTWINVLIYNLSTKYLNHAIAK